MVDNKLMVFESNPDCSDNSRRLRDYVKNNTDFEISWIVKNSKFKNLLN